MNFVDLLAIALHTNLLTLAHTHSLARENENETLNIQSFIAELCPPQSSSVSKLRRGKLGLIFTYSLLTVTLLHIILHDFFCLFHFESKRAENNLISLHSFPINEDALAVYQKIKNQLLQWRPLNHFTF